MNRKILLVTLFILVFSCVSVFAAPATLSPDAVKSTTSGILTVTNPSTASISTYDKSQNISGYAASGAEVSIYMLKDGVYNLLYNDDAPVGASGMFISPITLQYGKNDIIVRAELNGNVQYASKTINVLRLSPNLLNLFKGFKLF